jgi:NADH-quinone oxidoreductase subunit C
MSEEKKIKDELMKKFKFSEQEIIIPRTRRIFFNVELANFEEVFIFAAQELKFAHLVSITGFDEQDRLGFMYHLAKDNGIILNIKTSVSKDNPVIKTVTKYFPGAEIYERELIDLFGAKIEGLPAGNRYPLTDDWPTDQFPLRKDWKPKA